MESIGGLWPGVVESYDGGARTCRVSIPGVTDGSNDLPEAVFCNALGDRGNAGDNKDHTETRVLPGDSVWLMFEAGDPRYPIIMGYRTAREGNPTGWRRWRHANIEMTADNELIINAAKVTWNVSGDVRENIGGKLTTSVAGAMESTAASSKHNAATHQLTAKTTISGAVNTVAGPGGSGAALQGPVAVTGGGLTHNGKNVGDTHTHPENNVPGGSTNSPN